VQWVKTLREEADAGMVHRRIFHKVRSSVDLNLSNHRPRADAVSTPTADLSPLSATVTYNALSSGQIERAA
jgi:hypothetical protein